MDEKRIYSLNLAAFIIASTGLEPEVKLEEETNLYYCKFPENEEVSNCIAAFRQPQVQVDLHSFINTFRELKAKIKALRG